MRKVGWVLMRYLAITSLFSQKWRQLVSIFLTLFRKKVSYNDTIIWYYHKCSFLYEIEIVFLQNNGENLEQKKGVFIRTTTQNHTIAIL